MFRMLMRRIMAVAKGGDSHANHDDSEDAGDTDTDGGDACLSRLSDVMVPACRSDLCSSQCCLSLTLPPRSTSRCTIRWIEAYEAQANFFRRRIARMCSVSSASSSASSSSTLTVSKVCKSRAKCPFSTQFVDSPCSAVECAAFYTTGEMSAACKSFIYAYCTKYSHSPELRALFSDARTCDRFVTRGVSVAQLVQDVQSDCQHYYDELPTFRDPMQLPIVCLDWLQRTCVNQGNCTCFISSVDLWSPNTTYITPCISFDKLNLDATKELDRQLATSVYFLITIAFLIVWKLAGGATTTTTTREIRRRR